MLAAMLTACGPREEKLIAEKPPAPPAVPSPLLATNAPPRVPRASPEIPLLPESVATIKGRDEVSVKAPHAGFLVRQVYRDDAMVDAGDVLFLLDSRTSHEGPASDADLIKVTAPKAGAPSHARCGLGDRVESGDELTTVAEIDNVVAELTLPDELARKFSAYPSEPPSAVTQSRQNIELILPGGVVYPARGTIANVAASGKTNTMQVYFPNFDHILRPGEFVTVRGVATPATSQPASPPSR